MRIYVRVLVLNPIVEQTWNSIDVSWSIHDDFARIAAKGINVRVTNERQKYPCRFGGNTYRIEIAREGLKWREILARSCLEMLHRERERVEEIINKRTLPPAGEALEVKVDNTRDRWI